jgi:hypothetical protein
MEELGRLEPPARRFSPSLAEPERREGRKKWQRLLDTAKTWVE